MGSIHSTGYKIHSYFNCIEPYVKPGGVWERCPNCGLRPKVWVFNNGEGTACGCWKSRYDGFSVHAESVGSVFKRNGDTSGYKATDLRGNWNHWCLTGEIIFEHASKRDDKMW